MGPKGLMTLPKEKRNALGIEEGDRVLLKVERTGGFRCKRPWLYRPPGLEKKLDR
ncbi:MAG: AbrB/MazE/SpoVT family DNA-binding domain-containing protein [Bacillota bacterium]